MNDFEIKCDEELNTPDVVNRNEIRARILFNINRPTPSFEAAFGLASSIRRYMKMKELNAPDILLNTEVQIFTRRFKKFDEIMSKEEEEDMTFFYNKLMSSLSFEKISPSEFCQT